MRAGQTRSRADHPVDLFEEIVRGRAWTYGREGPGMVVADVEGSPTETVVHALWDERLSTVLVAATCDLPVGPGRKHSALELLAFANGRLGIGHFCWDPQWKLFSFRHTVPLRGAVASVELLEDVLDAAVHGMDSYYPAFQNVIRGGMSPRDAVATAILVTAGEA